MYRFLISFFISIGFITNAQVSRQKLQIDSLTEKLKTDSLHIYHFQKFRLIAAIDNRNSFIKKQAVNLYGFQVATVYKEKHTIGLGFYSLSAHSKNNSRSKTSDSRNTILTDINLKYMTVFYQPALIDTRYFELDLPFEIGLGKFTINRQDSASGTILKPINSAIFPLGAGIMGIIKPFKWIGISGFVGYRYAKERNINFDGSYYSIGLWLDVRQVLRDCIYRLKIKPKYRKEIKKINV